MSGKNRMESDLDLDLDKAGKVKQGKNKNLTLSRKQMLRVAEKAPQAMVKITSYASGAGRAGATASYISREGELPMETGEGDILTGKEDIADNLSEWSHDFGERKNSRDAMHMVLSTPSGSDRVAAHRAVRAFSAEMFSGNHSYMFAMHNDTDNPHGHLMVKMRGHDGVKLDPRKADLKRYREVFAEKCQEQGINVDSSPRLARGAGSKGKSLSVVKMAERGAQQRVKDGFMSTVKDSFAEFQEKGRVTLKPWEKKAKAITERYRASYMDEAEKIKAESKKLGGKEGAVLASQAKSLVEYAKAMPEPQSLREQAVRHIQAQQEANIER